MRLAKQSWDQGKIQLYEITIQMGLRVGVCVGVLDAWATVPLQAQTVVGQNGVG